MPKTGIAYAVVSPNSPADYTTVQAAIDALEKSIFVKAGKTVAGWNQNVDAVEVHTGPGVTVSSGINVTGANCGIILGPGTTVSGEIDSTTGAEFFLEAMNGCTLGLIDIGTARSYFNGGGWGTVAASDSAQDNVRVNASDCILENFAVDRGDVAGGYAAVSFIGGTNPRGAVRLAKVDNEDDFAIYVWANEADVLILGCITLSVGLTYTLDNNAVRTRTIGNSVVPAGTSGLNARSTAADGVYVGNVTTAPPVNRDCVLLAGSNHVVVGNRNLGFTGTGVAINDGSTNSTTAANDNTA